MDALGTLYMPDCKPQLYLALCVACCRAVCRLLRRSVFTQKRVIVSNICKGLTLAGFSTMLAMSG